jgi:hypothetical protein
MICLQIPTTLIRWKNYFSRLLKLLVHRVSDDRQIEMHTAGPLVSDPSPFDVETAIEKLKGINCQAVIKFRQNLFK